MYSKVRNAVYNVEYRHLKSLDLARESNTFCTSWSGPWNSSFWPCYWQFNPSSLFLPWNRLNACLSTHNA